MNAPSPPPLRSVPPAVVAQPPLRSMHPGLPLLLKRAQEKAARRRFVALRALLSSKSDVKIMCIVLAVGLLVFWLTR